MTRGPFATTKISTVAPRGVGVVPGLGVRPYVRVALEEPGLDRLEHHRRRPARRELSLDEVSVRCFGDHASVVGEEELRTEGSPMSPPRS